ncbi:MULTISPECIES: REP-associated tyrosine transposase [unclassified Nostoc]|uniref:REP-associated tyrosine transposase n=1 Tax=unclassified Nostoc TaxID=2593658 RepID=UPI000B95A7B5|nr:transposase [Nostoc sp. 'Peltigera membranacea cyanobiont' 232]OYE02278.1 transposase [Nostoc sp. 'Peltigera membranacea cyanobiont' 232]
MQYRRATIEGGTYFFTLVTHKRQRLLCLPTNVSLLRNIFRYVMHQHPFIIDAFVLLPDHLHCIWTLPQGDCNFSTRWRLIKSYFSRQCITLSQKNLSTSRQNKKERGIWQRRFWEHLIRDEVDFKNHLEYIHYNPVKHGLVKAPKDWEYSSFHRSVRQGMYDITWGAGQAIVFDSDIAKE